MTWGWTTFSLPRIPGFCKVREVDITSFSSVLCVKNPLTGTPREGQHEGVLQPAPPYLQWQELWLSLCL